MSACTYNVGGKNLTQAEIEEEIKLIGAHNFKLSHLSQDMISIEQAKAIVKSWLPNAIIEGTGSWLKIIPTLINSQKLDPSQNLMAKIADGAIVMESDFNNQISRRMLTHELIHLTYKYGMSQKWKERFNKSLEEEYGKSLSDLLPHQIEHLVARVFEESTGPKRGLSRYLDMFKSIFNFFLQNKKDLKTLGSLLASGYFSDKVTNIELEYRANYNMISKYFNNNPNAYEAAKAWLMSNIYKITQSTINGLPITREDAVARLKGQLDSEKTSISIQLDKTKSIAEAFGAKIRLKKAEGKLVERFINEQYVKNIEKQNDLEAKLLALNTITAAPTTVEENPIVVQLLKEIFPVWSLDHQFINSIIKGFESEDRYVKFSDDEKNADSLRNETKIVEREDEQHKTSNAVKDFLSFVPIMVKNPDTGTLETPVAYTFSLNNFVPFRYAFARTIEFFTNYIELFNTTTESLNAVINHIKKEESLNSYSESIINALHNLFQDANHYPDNTTKSVTVRMYQEPVSKKIYYATFVSKNGEDISYRSTGELIQRKNDRNAPWHTITVAASDALDTLTDPTKVSIMEQLYNKASTYNHNLTKKEFTDIYNHYKAVDTLNEMHNHLGSLDERDYYIAIGEWFKGKFSARFVSASGTDVKVDMKNQLQTAFISAISAGTMKKDQTIELKDNRDVFEFFTKKLSLEHVIHNINLISSDIKVISSKLNSIRKAIPILPAKSTVEEVEKGMSDWLENNNKFFSDISRILLKEDATISNPSILDSEGNRVYKNTVSSFGIKVLNLLHSVNTVFHPNLVNTPWEGGTLEHFFKADLFPEFIFTPLYRLNAFYKGINKLQSRVTLYDAYKNPYIDKSWSFNKETSKIWWSRNFVFGFLSGLSGDTKTEEHKDTKQKQSYWQFFYQPSDKSRISMSKINVLSPTETKHGMKLIIEKLHYLKNIEGRNLKYTNSSYFSPTLNPHIEKLLESDKNSPAYNSLMELAIEHAFSNIVLNAYHVYDNKVAKYKIGIPNNTESLYKVFLKSTPLVQKAETSDIRELFALWYLNNLVNGYHLNELVSGNPEYYSKGAVDVVKRQAGVWGPQIKPRVGPNGTSEKFTAWVLNDSVIPRSSSNNAEQSVKSFLDKMYQGRGIPEEQMESEKADILDLFEKEGFKITDGGGFMHPSRWNDLSKGFGTSYRLGNVMKPMHFQIRTHYKISKYFNTEAEARAYIDKNKGLVFGDDQGRLDYSPSSTIEVLEQDGTQTQQHPVFIAVSEPVYIKYATMVLSDHLLGITEFTPVGKYPALFLLRKMMESRTDRHGNPIGEILFNSSIKLGAPAKSNLRTTQDVVLAAASLTGGESANLSGVEMGIHENELLELDNRFYGFQFNPTTKALKNVSHPTQLEYLSNLLDENEEASRAIYGSIALINEIEADRFRKKLRKAGNLTKYLKSLLSSPDTERIQHLLEEGTSINMPTIESKVIIQLVASITKAVIDIKSRGGKLILQGVEGITSLNEQGVPANLFDIGYKSAESEALSYTNKDGKTVADAIVPRDMLTEEQIELIKNGGSVYLLGFRIPSTEIHSMILLKVHSFYDKIGTNVIIVPKEVLPIHGADLDVDSLFTLAPEIINKDIIINDIKFKKNSIVGKKAIYNLKDKIVGYADDYDTWSNAIKAELQNTKDEKRIDELQRLQIKIAKNTMLDNFIDIAGSTRNIKRMNTPISKEEFQRHKETISGVKSGLQVLADRGLTQYDNTRDNPFESIWDLTKAEDSNDSHESINEGMQLTGVFANNLKVLSILAKAGLTKDSIALKYKIKWNSISDGVVDLLSIRDFNFNLKSGLTWQTLDALINLAIDNAKDQILNKFFINSKNANLTSMLFGLGLTVPEFALLTGTSLWRRASSDEFTNFNKGLLTLASTTKYGEQLFSKLLEAKKKDVKLRGDENKNSIYTSILSFETLDKFISLEQKIQDKEVLSQVEKDDYEDIKIAILDLMHTGLKLGSYVKLMSEVLTSLRDIEPDVESVQKLYSKMVRAFGLKPIIPGIMAEEQIAEEEALELQDLQDTLELAQLDPILVNEKGQIKGEPASPNNSKSKRISLSATQLDTTDTMDFIKGTTEKMPQLKSVSTHSVFDIRNIFKVNPHIFTAFRNVEYIYQLIKENFLIHSNELDLFASFKSGFKLDRSVISHTIAVKRELAKFILTNNTANRVFKEWNNTTSLKKWVENFKTDIDALKKYENSIQLDPDFKVSGYRPNIFLKFITVGYSKHTTSSGKKSTRKSIKVHSGLNMSNTDIYNAMEGFKALNRFYKNTDGTWGFRNDLAPARTIDSFTELQKGLLLYNVLTAGMAYGSSNYSIFIPPAIYKELQDEFDKQLGQLIKDYNNIQEVDTPNKFQSKIGFIMSFYMKLATLNINKVGRIKVEEEDDLGDLKRSIRLIKNKLLEGKGPLEDFSVNRGVHIGEDKVPIFYDLVYEVEVSKKINTPTINDVYVEESGLTEVDTVDEIEDFDKDPAADVKVQEAIAQVEFPPFIRKGNSVYITPINSDNKVFYQRVGDETSVETSILPVPLSYDWDYYFNPHFRSVIVNNIEAETYLRIYFDLSYELDTQRPFRLVDSANLFRISERWVKVESFDKTKGEYKLQTTDAPIHPKFNQTTEGFTSHTEVLPNFPALAPPQQGPDMPQTRFGLSAGSSSTLSKIEEEGRQWVDREETNVVHEPNIVRKYDKIDKNGIKETITRLTDGVLGLVNTYFRRKPYDLLRNQAIHAKADELWKDKLPEEKQLFPTINKEPLNKEEYITKRKQTSDKAINTGTGGHYLIQAYINLINGHIDRFQYYENKAKELLGEDEYSLVSWLLTQDGTNQVYAKLILEKAGVNLRADLIASEVRIGSSIWGYGSTIDMLVEHLDKTFSIIDFKFGRYFNRANIPLLMKHGLHQHQIFESPKEIAKLEIMLRALILKTEYPEARFKNLMVLWTPSKDAVRDHPDASRFVEVELYLNMIKANLKEEYNKAATQELKAQTIYGKLLALPHFDQLFSPSEYYAGYSDQPLNSKVIVEGTPDVRLKRYMEELRKNVLWDLNPFVKTDRNDTRSSIKRARLHRAEELTNAILELKKTELSNMKWDEDLSWLSLYLGSNRDIDNAYVSIYSKFLDDANNKAFQRFSVIEQLYKAYLKPMVDDYRKRETVGPSILAGQQDRSGFWTGIDPTKFWEAIYKHDETGKNIVQLNLTEKDWEEAAVRYSYLRDPNTLLHYKNMSQFINDNLKQFFVDSFSHYGQAMANRPATWRVDEGKERMFTDLELHLNPQPALGGRKKSWEHYDGWFPKLPITHDELGWLAQIPIIRNFSKEYRNHMAQRFTVNYAESELLQERNLDEAIPWRYLGNAQIDGSQEFSKNLEHAFLGFMKYHILKEERTDVFAFGRGLMEKAKASEDQYRGKSMKNVIEYLDKAIKMQVQGLRQVDFQGGLMNKEIPLIRTINGRAERPDWVKIIRAIKTSSAAPIMLLKPFQGIANFIFISLYTLKEGMKDSIIKGVKDNKFLGVDSDFTSFTTQDLSEAWIKDYGAFMKDSMTGNLHKNKLWTLAKKFNYIPDSYDLYVDSNRKSIMRGKIFEQSTMYMFHSVPEEAMSMVIMAAQMRHMKLNTTNPAYKGKTLWDMYELKELSDPKTGVKYFDYVWKDDFVRGNINTAPAGVEPVYTQLKGLDTNELRRMKYVYQRMQGGYRADEKTYLEYFVLGELLLQFKRYLPTLLRNYGQSRSKIDSYGMYKPKMVDGKVIMKDGVEVIEWVSRMVEGRAKVFTGWLLNAMNVRYKAGDNLNLKDKLFTALGFEGLESYSWKNLDSSSRELLVDFGVTGAMYLAILGVYLGMGGSPGDKDKDPWLLFVSRINKNIGQQFNLVEAIREVKELGLPSTAKVSWYRVSALSDLVWSSMLLAAGEEDKALTKQGTLHGTNQFIKYWMPYGGSYYDFVRLILGEENVDEFTLSPNNIRK